MLTAQSNYMAGNYRSYSLNTIEEDYIGEQGDSYRGYEGGC